LTFANGASDVRVFCGHYPLRGSGVWLDDDVIAEDYSSLVNHGNQGKRSLQSYFDMLTEVFAFLFKDFTLSDRLNYPVLIRIKVACQFFVKFSNIKFNQNRYIIFRVVSCERTGSKTDGQTQKTVLTGALQGSERP
jgi:hypothetical protein